MDGITEELKGFAGFIFDGIKEVLGHIPQIINFCLWVLAGIFILPCVFVAGNFFGAWEKWGEDF